MWIHITAMFRIYLDCIPAKQISPVTTPEFADAAKKTLELRGDAGTGWSLAWKINIWARLLDGNHAYTMIQKPAAADEKTVPIMPVVAALI